MYDLKTRISNICGHKFISIYNKSFTTTSISLTLRIGSINDVKGKNGLTWIVIHYLIFSNNKTYQDIKSKALNFKIQVEREYTMISIECYDKQYEEMLKLLMQIFKDFVYDNDILEMTKKYALKTRNIKNDDTISFLEISIHESVFTRQVVGKNIYGRHRTIENIDLSDVHEFYYRLFNNKNIFITIASAVNYKDVHNFVKDLLKNVFFTVGPFNSFKKYRLNGKSRYIYRNSNTCYVGVIYQADGIRKYHNYIYLKMILDIIMNNQEVIFGKNRYMFLDIKQFTYNRIGLLVIYFVVDPENINEFYNIIKDLADMHEKITVEMINKIMDLSMLHICRCLHSSLEMCESAAFHFMHLKKAKRVGFDVGVKNSLEILYLKRLLMELFDQENSSLCVVGPKIDKKIIQILNGS